MKATILEIDKRLARVLANTRTSQRSLSISKIAEDILWLKAEFGSIKIVSEKIGVSVEMINRFLAILKLCSQVRKLVDKRIIDSVEVVNHLAAFNKDDQNKVADIIVDGTLTSADVKALRSYVRKSPNADIKETIKHFLETKDKKSFVLYVYIPSKKAHAAIQAIYKITGRNEILFYRVQNNIGTIKLTKIGLKRLREAAHRERMNMREFIKRLL